MSGKSKLIQRYTAGDRVNHSLLALFFIFAGLTGLAFLHPSMFWLSSLFGGGQWTQFLHPLFGVLMFVFFFVAMVKFWKHNLLTGNDFRWLGRLGDVMKNREDNLPPVGKYNPGQKLLFWSLVLAMPLLLVSGIALWQPWFAPMFPIGVVRVAGVVHVLSALVLFLGMIVHIYSALFWIKGSTRAMTRGTVTDAWARKHHPLWHREMTSGEKH